ncbi:unnamed protein product [Cryptosporidium hominis]|uniref:Uncharacterized protein n=1 Tax=Cryptosporidium hominis TaxID=237895 RepID=A0A0S4TFH2_CRYHO|nr:hypothetical protein [Cryptosporidium hominis TU502]OLQ17160.1 hypothetical protein ChTU502y2012_401g0225 [Cryptosporidium hominis]PPA65171.1 hypothetical protein ChUKH1_15795 [Cryptosporidium hominis]PPS93772.1 Uncharacterized protein GY17_00002518 [Cryptosporidium hominis]CUV05216.1 unnamed protein product [Cryptosporidium hominis]|eukprot:PPS93772.1 Uncharacterized protein GY17_00002518 [Cryptosporidium hominis]
MSYIECSKVGRVNINQLEDLLDLLKSLCVEVKLVKWRENTWCPNVMESHCFSRKLDFTKAQKHAEAEARILQYIYPTESKDLVNISYQTPIIEPTTNSLEMSLTSDKDKKATILVNKVVECFSSKSILEIIQHLNIGSLNSTPPTLYNTLYISCYMCTFNPLKADEVVIFVQTEFKDINFNYNSNDHILVILKSKCLNENVISTNKQAILNLSKKLEKIVSF